MRKLTLLLSAFAGFMASLNAQTLFLKPGPAAGLDAQIITMDGGCLLAGLTTPSHLTNYGSYHLMGMTDWTYVAGGCSGGTLRSLIKFAGLSAIPSGATITSATLTLYHPPADPDWWGNNFFPGTPLPNTNPGSVYRVDPSAAGVWNEGTVTWQSQPPFLTALSGAIPVTTTQWNGSVSADVTSLVQDIVTTGLDNGFMLKLDTEVHYRAQVYATSDNADPALWPELTVVYSVKDGCNADFNYCLNTNNPYVMDLSANSITSGAAYDWTVDGSYVGSGSSFSHTFPGPGSYKVCLTVTERSGERCERCFQVCVPEMPFRDPSRCDATFYYCVNTTNPYMLNFTANTTSGVVFDWRIDGSPAGSGASINHVFGGPGTHEVCLTVTDRSGERCELCYIVCLDDNGKPVATLVDRPAPPTEAISPKQDEPSMLLNNELVVAPNPAFDRVTISAAQAIQTVQIISAAGVEAISLENVNKKEIALSIAQLAPGIYFIEVLTQGGSTMNKKLIKH